MEDDSNDLFAIDISSDESASETTAIPKVPRDFQSEEDFQSTRSNYKVKVENGELHKQVQVPIDQPSKQTSQKILHAIEELYFYQRYREALALSEVALEGELDADFKKVVEAYRLRCLKKLEV